MLPDVTSTNPSVPVTETGRAYEATANRSGLGLKQIGMRKHRVFPGRLPVWLVLASPESEEGRWLRSGRLTSPAPLKNFLRKDDLLPPLGVGRSSDKGREDREIQHLRSVEV